MPWIIFTLFILILIVISLITIHSYRDLKTLKLSFLKLSQSFDELDEQAKLIVKTDLELNKTQEELDKRLGGLDALQKLSQAINTTLDENEIFSRLSQNLLSELGFDKYLFLLIKGSSFETKRLSGFTQEENIQLQQFLKGHQDVMENLFSGASLSSLSLPADIKTVFSDILSIENFIISPIITQNHLLGVAVAGNDSASYLFTAGDTEIISILTAQLGQAIENARLFEQVYRSRQELELKIQDRTRELTEALEKVQRINKTKSDFISAVSHELRTPLTSIKGYSSILITGKIGEIPNAVKERLEKINKHSDSLVALINDLLDISRIESGKADLKFKYHSLKILTDNIEDLLTPQFKEKSITFQRHIPEDLPKVFIDEGQIERVFINLIGNAIKFTPPQGVITVSAVESDQLVAVSVADTGIGLKKEELEKLFSEFYRVENEINQNVKGTGLGLSLIKRIVEAHNGTISVKSKFGEGAVFSFTLPTSDFQKAAQKKTT
jgi:signal transduction histidine kinase